jgi:hypothetical protein
MVDPYHVRMDFLAGEVAELRRMLRAVDRRTAEEWQAQRQAVESLERAVDALEDEVDRAYHRGFQRGHEVARRDIADQLKGAGLDLPEVEGS